jgi:glutathione S-transferase
MSLTLFYHPLASFCWKVQIALYENGTEFRGEIVNLADKASSARFFELWPMGKMPLLFDERTDRAIPETSIIIEYLDRHHPGQRPLLPADEDQRLDARLWDRFFDFYVQAPMQRIVANQLRADSERDPRTVDESIEALQLAYRMIEQRMANRTWAAGENFSMADCAAFPALFYATTLQPFTAMHSNASAYFERLLQRTSVTRVLDEARPYFQYYPFRNAIPQRFC